LTEPAGNGLKTISEQKKFGAQAKMTSRDLLKLDHYAVESKSQRVILAWNPQKNICPKIHFRSFSAGFEDNYFV